MQLTAPFHLPPHRNILTMRVSSVDHNQSSPTRQRSEEGTISPEPKIDDAEEATAVTFTPYLVQDGRLLCQQSGQLSGWFNSNPDDDLEPTIPGGFAALPPYRRQSERPTRCSFPRNNHVQYSLHIDFEIDNEEARNLASWDCIKQLKLYLQSRHKYTVQKAEQTGHIAVSIFKQEHLAILEFAWSHTMPLLDTFVPIIDNHPAVFHERGLSCELHHATISFLCKTILPFPQAIVDINHQLMPKHSVVEMWQAIQYEKTGPNEEDRSQHQELGRYYLLLEIYRRGRELSTDPEWELQRLPNSIRIMEQEYDTQILRHCGKCVMCRNNDRKKGRVPANW